jgi:carboxyl-terminal processing protease
MNRYIPVLHLRRYDDLGALKVTIQKFYRVSGDSTQYNGVTPDVVLPDVLEHLDSGEKSLDYSLPWDQIVGAAYSPMPALGLDVEAVRGASASRVATDEKFQEIVRESERIMERNEESMTPIDLASMRALRAEEKALSANGTSLDEVTEQVLGNGKKPKKSLEEEIDEDPYVQEALRLLSRFKGQDLAREELRGRSAIFFL